MEQDMHWRVSGVPPRVSLRELVHRPSRAVLRGLPASLNACRRADLSNDACNRLVGRYTYVVSDRGVTYCHQARRTQPNEREIYTANETLARLANILPSDLVLYRRVLPADDLKHVEIYRKIERTDLFEDKRDMEERMGSATSV